MKNILYFLQGRHFCSYMKSLFGQSNTFLRNDEIVKKQFMRFLIPSVASTIALSLNQFADSIIVAQLLGSSAMSVVNLGVPIMMAFAVVYMLFGTGGSVVYANYLGKMEKKKAGGVFSFTLLSAFVVSALVACVGIVFNESLSGILCSDQTLLAEFSSYAKILFVSTVPIVVIQVVINFLPAAGSPKLATFINLLANVTNLVFDYVFIHFGGMDVTGAAWATFGGYIVGFLFLMLWVLLKKCRIPLEAFTLDTVKSIRQIAGGGVSAAMVQLGFAVKFSYCNIVAGKIAGVVGITAFAGGMQTISIVSVIMAGIASAIVPLIAVMNAQRDFAGIRFLTARALKLQFVVNMALALLFLFFPTIITTMYNINDPKAYDMTITAVRIFTVMFVVRGFVQIALFSNLALGRKVYSFVISTFDGFVGIVPLVYVLSKLLGIDGLWIAYPACAVLIVVGIYAYNLIARRHLDYRASLFLLLPKEGFKGDILDISLRWDIGKASEVSKLVYEYCGKYGIDSQKSNLLAIACEEIFVYTLNHSGENRVNMDIRITLEKGVVEVYVKSVGVPFDHVSADQEQYGNIWMIKKISTDFKYDYLLGLNQTVIKLATQKI